MTKRKTRPEYVKKILNDVNEHLRNYKVKDEYGDNLFRWMCDYLLKKGMYEGYNFFKDKEFDNGEIHPVHAGSADPDKYEYLQIY